MKKLSVYLAMFFVCATVFGLNLAQAQTQATTDNNKSRNEQRAAEFRFESLVAQARPMRRVGFSLIPSSNNGKWTGISRSNSFTSDSTNRESKFVLAGIGTDTPASKLTIQGMIETTLGGLTFPNGTLQPASAGN